VEKEEQASKPKALSTIDVDYTSRKQGFRSELQMALAPVGLRTQTKGVL
jgi:hypothetical protein